MLLVRSLTVALLAMAAITFFGGVSFAADTSVTIYRTSVEPDAEGLVTTPSISVRESSANVEVIYTNTSMNPMSISVLEWNIGPGRDSTESGLPVLYFPGAATWSVTDFAARHAIGEIEVAGTISCEDQDPVAAGSAGFVVEPGDSVYCWSSEFVWTEPVPGQFVHSDALGDSVDPRVHDYGELTLSSINDLAVNEPEVSTPNGVPVRQVSVGDEVQYSFVVTNTGFLSETDSILGVGSDDRYYTCEQEVLAPGETTLCTAEVYSVWEDDAIDGQITAVAHVLASTDDGAEIWVPVDLPTLTLVVAVVQAPGVPPTANSAPATSGDSLATTGSGDALLLTAALLAVLGGVGLVIQRRVGHGRGATVSR